MALTGFLLNGVCVANSNEAILLFASKYPMVTNGFLQSVNSISFSAPSSLNINFSSNDIQKNQVAVNTSKTINLLTCDPAISIPNGVVFDSLTAASFWSFGLVFVVGSWLVAKNTGLILSAIKRW